MVSQRILYNDKAEDSGLNTIVSWLSDIAATF